MMNGLATGVSPEKMIAEVVKATLTEKSSAEVTGMMKAHFMQMKLMNGQGVWANDTLASIGHKLVPGQLNGDDLAKLVDVMAKNASENPYLHEFLAQAGGADFDSLFRLVGEEGHRILPDVVAYCMVLELLTQEMRSDWKVLEACFSFWGKAIPKKVNSADVKKHCNIFERAKMASVDYPIRRMLEIHREGKVPSNFCAAVLPVNILEAALMDLELGNRDNVKVGWTLAANRPGGAANEATGSGPACFSADGQGIDIHMPLKKEWTDLYQTWNLAFCSHYENFPYFMAKLLIPSVSGYQGAPEEYMYSRAIALNTHINFELLGRINGGASKYSMNWASPGVTKTWGAVNNHSRHGYKAALKDVPLRG